MSQLNDIKKTFIEFAKKYKWSKQETAENMDTILANCEWGLPVFDVLDESGEVDYEATAKKETEYVYKLLWS